MWSRNTVFHGVPVAALAGAAATLCATADATGDPTAMRASVCTSWRRVSFPLSKSRNSAATTLSIERPAALGEVYGAYARA